MFKSLEASIRIDARDMQDSAASCVEGSFKVRLNASKRLERMGTPSTKAMSMMARAPPSSRPHWMVILCFAAKTMKWMMLNKAVSLRGRADVCFLNIFENKRLFSWPEKVSAIFLIGLGTAITEWLMSSKL